MLVLSRKEGEGIRIRNTSTGETIEVFVKNQRRHRTTVGIDAPAGFAISRIEAPETPTSKTVTAETRQSSFSENT
jgi:sRNA-binding carbon storage regulator CsrA